MSVAVTTRGFGPTRSGVNLAETVLTQHAVRTRGIRRVGAAVLPGDGRGTEGSALIAPDVAMPDGLVHDVLVQAGMGGYVCAWDAATLVPLWTQRVVNPVSNSRDIDSWLINDHWGPLATPVLDLETGTIYLTSMHSPDGSYARGLWQFMALDIRTGAMKAPPVDLGAASHQPGHGLPLQRFGTVERKQRAALLLTSISGVRTVFVCAGSFNEDNRNQGWVLAIDVTANRPSIACAWSTTSRHDGAGIWMAGQGPVSDGEGCIGFVTGNGAFDGVTDFGECFVKLRYTPASRSAGASLAVDSYACPFTDTGLVGGNPTLADVSLIPGYEGSAEQNASNMNGASDADLGSAGAVLILAGASGLSRDVVVFSGKHGVLYIADWNDLGSPRLADFAQDRIQAGVYAKFLSEPIWGTYYNPEDSAAPVDLARLVPIYGKTHHMHAAPVFYRSRAHGPCVFLWGENSNLRCFRINADFSFEYLACSAEVASANCGGTGGMPGGMISLSADGDAPGSAVLWATIPYGDANKDVGPGRMLAYDPEIFLDGAIQVLWDSERWGDEFVFNKFNVATAANGRLYRPDYDGTVALYQLA